MPYSENWKCPYCHKNNAFIHWGEAIKYSTGYCRDCGCIFKPWEKEWPKAMIKQPTGPWKETKMDIKHEDLSKKSIREMSKKYGIEIEENNLDVETGKPFEEDFFGRFPIESEITIIPPCRDDQKIVPLEDLRVYEPENKNDLRLGWVIRERCGSEVFKLSQFSLGEDKKITMEMIKELDEPTKEKSSFRSKGALTDLDDLKVDDDIVVSSAFYGWIILKVKSVEPEAKTAYASDGGMGVTLNFDIDDRHCWTTGCFFNEAALERINFG